MLKRQGNLWGLRFFACEHVSLVFIFVFVFEMESRSVTQARVQWCNLGSLLTATSTSWVQAILLPQPPKLLPLQATVTMLGYFFDF